MKHKSLNFIIPLVVYPFDVMVSFCQSDQDLTKSLNRNGWKWDDLLKLKGDGKFVLFPEFNGTVIRMRHYPDNPDRKGTLAHEVFHAVTYILDLIGMDFKINSSDEAYSYLTGYITKEIYKKFEK